MNLKSSKGLSKKNSKGPNHRVSIAIEEDTGLKSYRSALPSHRSSKLNLKPQPSENTQILKGSDSKKILMSVNST